MSPCGQPCEGLSGGRVVAADQHAALLLEIGVGGRRMLPRQRPTTVTWMCGQRSEIGQDFARRQQGLAPAQRIGAVVGLNVLSWSGAHELKPNLKAAAT
jgi:hypothetical protein